MSKKGRELRKMARSKGRHEKAFERFVNAHNAAVAERQAAEQAQDPAGAEEFAGRFIGRMMQRLDMAQREDAHAG
jgi:hypothetical protein